MQKLLFLFVFQVICSYAADHQDSPHEKQVKFIYAFFDHYHSFPGELDAIHKYLTATCKPMFNYLLKMQLTEPEDYRERIVHYGRLMVEMGFQLCMAEPNKFNDPLFHAGVKIGLDVFKKIKRIEALKRLQQGYNIEIDQDVFDACLNNFMLGICEDGKELRSESYEQEIRDVASTIELDKEEVEQLFQQGCAVRYGELKDYIEQFAQEHEIDLGGDL